MSLLHICHRLVLILFLLIKQSRNNYIFILSATSLSSSHAWLILLINRQNLWPCVKLSRSLPRGIPWGNLRPSNWWISPRRHFTPSAVYMEFVNRTQFWKGVQVFFFILWNVKQAKDLNACKNAPVFPIKINFDMQGWKDIHRISWFC